MDPKLTSDGRPFSQFKVDDILRQSYIITRHCNTPYSDVLEMTPMERETLIGIIREELKKQDEALTKSAKSKKKGR